MPIRRSRPTNKKTKVNDIPTTPLKGQSGSTPAKKIVERKMAQAPDINPYILRGEHSGKHRAGVDYQAIKDAAARGVKQLSVAGISTRSVSPSLPYGSAWNINQTNQTAVASKGEHNKTPDGYVQEWSAHHAIKLQAEQGIDPFGDYGNTRTEGRPDCYCQFSCGGSTGNISVRPGECSGPCPALSMHNYGWEQDIGWACCSCDCAKVRLDYMAWMGDGYCDGADYQMTVDPYGYPACHPNCDILEHQISVLGMDVPYWGAPVPVNFMCSGMGYDCMDIEVGPGDGYNYGCDSPHEDGQQYHPDQFIDEMNSWCIPSSCRGKCQTGCDGYLDPDDWQECQNVGGGGISFWGPLLGQTEGLGFAPGHCFCDDLCEDHEDCCWDYVQECVLEDSLDMPCDCYGVSGIVDVEVPPWQKTASTGKNCADFDEGDEGVCRESCDGWCAEEANRYKFRYEDIKNYGAHPSCSLRAFHLGYWDHEMAKANSGDASDWFEPWVSTDREDSECTDYEGIGWFWDSAKCKCWCHQPESGVNWFGNGGEGPMFMNTSSTGWVTYNNVINVGCNNTFACNYMPGSTCSKEFVDDQLEEYPYADDTSTYASAEYCEYSAVYPTQLDGYNILPHDNPWDSSWIHSSNHPETNTLSQRESIFSWMMHLSEGGPMPGDSYLTNACKGCLNPYARNYTGDLNANYLLNENHPDYGKKWDCNGNLVAHPAWSLDEGTWGAWSGCCEVDVGCDDATACNYNERVNGQLCLNGIPNMENTCMPDQTGNAAVCHKNCLGCLDETATNYICNESDWANQNCIQCGCNPMNNTDINNCVTCADNPEEQCQYTEGCTDPNACNYDPNAPIDDGSCIAPGCTSADCDAPGAPAGCLNVCNYSSEATCSSTPACSGGPGNCVEVACEFNVGCGCGIGADVYQQISYKDTDCDGEPGAGAPTCESYCPGMSIPYCSAADGCNPGCDCLIDGINWTSGNWDENPNCACNNFDCLTGECCGCGGHDCPNSLDECGVCAGTGPSFECCDGSYVCSESDCLVEYDTCGVCDGEGAIYECGCNDILDNICTHPFTGNEVPCCDCNGGVWDSCDQCVQGNENGSIWNGFNQTWYGDGNTCCGNCSSCFGSGITIEDECGNCGGPGIPDGACNCQGDVLDCAGVCGGDAYIDNDPEDPNNHWGYTYGCGDCICYEGSFSAGDMNADCLIYPLGQNRYTDSCINPENPEDGNEPGSYGSECCGCGYLPPEEYWPDEDGDGFWCGNPALHCGGHPGDGWMSAAENGGVAGYEEEGANCNCEWNYFDCRGMCVQQGSDDESVYDQCNICGGSNDSCASSNAEEQQENCVCATCCNHPWSPMWDGSIWETSDMMAESDGCTSGICSCWACAASTFWHENMGAPGWTADSMLKAIWYDDRTEIWAEVVRFEVMPGDINADGMINILDVVTTVNMILGYDNIWEPWQFIAADFNGDGIVNIQDVIGIINTVLNNGNRGNSGNNGGRSSIPMKKFMSEIRNMINDPKLSDSELYVDMNGWDGYQTSSRDRNMHFLSGFNLEFNAPECIPEGVEWFLSPIFYNNDTCMGQYPCSTYTTEQDCSNPDDNHSCFWTPGAQFDMINESATLSIGGSQPSFSGGEASYLDGTLKIGAAYANQSVTVNSGGDYHLLTIMHPNVRIQADFDFRPANGGNVFYEVDSQDGSDVSIMGFDMYPTSHPGDCRMTNPDDCYPTDGSGNLRAWFRAWEYQCIEPVNTDSDNDSVPDNEGLPG